MLDALVRRIEELEAAITDLRRELAALRAAKAKAKT